MLAALEFTAKRVGGDITIVAPKVFLENGAQLNANTFALGDAGNLFVKANDLLSLSNNSTISSNVESGAVGNGGEINIETGSMKLINGSYI